MIFSPTSSISALAATCRIKGLQNRDTRLRLVSSKRCLKWMTLLGRLQNFRRMTSCSIALSRNRSATIFFSLPFSSSWPNRFISDGAKPAYFLRRF